VPFAAQGYTENIAKLWFSAKPDLDEKDQAL
jgi:hypothetical protein